MRSGDFSREASTLKDPLNSNAPFPGNRLPSERILPLAQTLLAMYPLPNFGPGTTETVSNYRQNAANPTTSYQWDARVDDRLTAKQSIFGRLSCKNQNPTSPNVFILPADTSYNDSRSVVVSHNYTITPALLNEFRFGIGNSNSATQYNFDGPKITASLGLQ